MNKHSGSKFDDFLKSEGIQEKVSAKVHKRLIALQLADIMQENRITKICLAERMQTSRSQLDRILDPNNTSVILGALERVAHGVDKKIRIELT
ncbi:MAG: hypothetical protein ACLFPB_07945 [Desulfovermiculus sp.]